MQAFGSILQLVLIVLSVSNGTTLGVYLLGLFYPKSNRIGGFWASVISWFSVAGLVVFSRLSMVKSGVSSPKLSTSIEKCDHLEELLNEVNR